MPSTRPSPPTPSLPPVLPPFSLPVPPVCFRSIFMSISSRRDSIRGTVACRSPISLPPACVPCIWAASVTGVAFFLDLLHAFRCLPRALQPHGRFGAGGSAWMGWGWGIGQNSSVDCQGLAGRGIRPPGSMMTGTHDGGMTGRISGPPL